LATSKNQDKKIYSPCASCDRATYHELLHIDVFSEYEYRMDTINEMLKCRGCHAISFRRVVRDYEGAYPIDGMYEEWSVPEEVTNYPSILEGHKELEDIWELPMIVRNIYTQSVQAIKVKSNTLAGIGLRATIEAICIDQTIGGRNLEKRIDSLAKGGLISQKDSERLHAIRFLGNDAAHEIKPVDAKHLLIALRIIDHLLVNIYILDNDADGRLDTIIKTFDQFEDLLNNNIPHFVSGDEVPLAKIFGRDVRRFHGYLQAHEAELKSRILNGTYTKLSIGKLAKYAGLSQQLIQHFIVI
jgi:hypothetical protein